MHKCTPNDACAPRPLPPRPVPSHPPPFHPPSSRKHSLTSVFNAQRLIQNGDEGNAEIPHFADQQKSGKVFGYGATAKEQLMVYITVRKHLTNGQPHESMEKFVLYAMETYRYLMQPPAATVSLVFDLEGFGLKSMDWHTLMYVIGCLEKYYPECLGTLYVLHAPWIFNGIWKTLAPMLDPVVRAKVQFIKRMPDAAPNLPAERVPKMLSGGIGSKYEYVYPEVHPGENDLLQDTHELEKRLRIRNDLWRQLMDVSAKWVQKGGDSSELMDQRRLLAKKIRIAHFNVEPYYRGSTVFDREHVLTRDGRVTWFYEPEKGGQTWRHVIGRGYAAPVLLREIRDVEQDNMSVSQAEDRTHEAMEKQDWVALYGSQDAAVEVEGAEALGIDRKDVTSRGEAGRSMASQTATPESGGKTGFEAGSAAATGAGAGAGAGVGAAAAAVGGGGAAHTHSKVDSGDAGNGHTSREGFLHSRQLRRINSDSSRHSYETFVSAATEIEALAGPSEPGTTSYDVPGSKAGETTTTFTSGFAPKPDAQRESEGEAGRASAQLEEPSAGRASNAVSADRTKSDPASTRSSFATAEKDHDGSDSRSTRRRSRLFGGSDTDSKSSLNLFRKGKHHHPHLSKLTDKVASKLKRDAD